MLEENKNLDISDIDAAEDYQMQSEINDMRQHANKIIQGIKSLNQHDANRAIWELFQNAVDLSNDCHIEVKINHDSLQFSHNGAPFTPMTLDCLFKQVSSKTLEEKKVTYEEDDPVGQYGTGFMTSHVFGKELMINSAILKGNGYIPLNNFIIDRRTSNWKVLANSIRDLKIVISNLLKENSTPFLTNNPRTEFTYKFASNQNKNAAQVAVESLSKILPIVMAINPSLSSVKVTENDGTTVIYRKGEINELDGLNVQEILVNDKVQEVCYIETDDKKTTIILPIDRNFNAFELDQKIPRLFLYYPLIGTEDFGCNFIFHSRQFQPTEPRNGLFLKSNNEANEKDEAQNRLLLNNATVRVIEFLRENIEKISNKIHLATLNFKVDSDDEFLNEYNLELKLNWIKDFKSLPLVEGNSKTLSTLQACFLDNEILSIDGGFDSAYPLAARFYENLPKKELNSEWTTIIDEWDIEDTKLINLEDIIRKIEGEKCLASFDNNELKKFYEFLLINEKSAYFSAFKILPNIYGDFRYLMGNEGLNNSINITEELIEIAKVIMPEVPKRHIKEDFRFNLELPDYNRKAYSSEIQEVIIKYIGEKRGVIEMDDHYLEKILDYLKLSSDLNSTSVPVNMIKLICRFYSKSDELIALPSIEDDKLDKRQVQKYAVRVFLNDLANKDSFWVSDNLEFLKHVLALSGYDAYKDMFETIAVYPNQLFELCKQNSLQIDDSIPVDILDLFDEVLKPNMPIRSTLVHDDFAKYLPSKEKRSIRSVTEQIERVFFNNNDIININDHPFKSKILNIVETFKSDMEYGKYYPLIHSQRSSILVSLADGEDSFAILSLPPGRINALATLGQDPNFEKILSLGKAALLTEQHENANFQHKYMLGRHIENILRSGLTQLLENEVKVEVKDEQNGQDIIVRIKNEPVFFIEVKSRWDKNNPIRMSKNQTLKAFNEKQRYALCSVDLTLFNSGDPLNVKEISEIENCIFVNSDIGDKVSHLIPVLSDTDSSESINLDGDIRTRVPMKYVETGITLNQFEKVIINYLQDLVNGK